MSEQYWGLVVRGIPNQRRGLTTRVNRPGSLKLAFSFKLMSPDTEDDRRAINAANYVFLRLMYDPQIMPPTHLLIPRWLREEVLLVLFQVPFA